MEGNLNIQGIQQVGIVVEDVEKTAEHYWQEFGIGPWQIFTFGPNIREMQYHGEPCSFSLRIAMAQVGTLLIELLQPLSGPTPHKDFLDRHGEGVQHLGIFVDRLEPAAEHMRQMGFRELTRAVGFGPDGDGAAAYFNTEEALGTTLELIEMSRGLPPIEKVIPAP